MTSPIDNKLLVPWIASLQNQRPPRAGQEPRQRVRKMGQPASLTTASACVRAALCCCRGCDTGPWLGAGGLVVFSPWAKGWQAGHLRLGVGAKGEVPFCGRRHSRGTWLSRDTEDAKGGPRRWDPEAASGRVPVLVLSGNRRWSIAVGALFAEQLVGVPSARTVLFQAPGADARYRGLQDSRRYRPKLPSLR